MITLPKPLAFVDIETTGMRLSSDRVIEIGVLRIENNKVIKTFSSLINPQCHIPPEIELLTGISYSDLQKAPLFREIKGDLEEILNDCIFVAHNVRFDYGFLKNEFKRVNKTFSSRHFCTVKLSKFLFPHYSQHNLDSIITRFNIPCKNRHRAFDDASVLWEFFQKVQNTVSQEALEIALNKALKKPSLPLKISTNDLDNIPESPGVYIFYGQDDIPLYIGKSINLKERILSHFSSNISSSIEMRISQQIERVETIPTSGELGALLKESYLIKKMQPLYNRKLRISRKLLALFKTKTKEGYETVSIKTLPSIPVDKLEEIMGVFGSKRQVKQFLIDIAKQYQLCEKLLGLEKTSVACFGYRLGRCNGACLQEESFETYNMKFHLAFSKNKFKKWPFKGPVVIEEKNELNEKNEAIVIDKWCYLGSAAYDSYGSENIIKKEFDFDLDTYKIIESYMRSPKNLKNIKAISAYSLQTQFFD